MPVATARALTRRAGKAKKMDADLGARIAMLKALLMRPVRRETILCR